MAFPSSTDTNTVVAGTSLLATVDHANQHNVMGSAMIALENKLGLGAGTPTATNKLLVATGNGTSVWGGTVNSLVLGTPTIGTAAITGGTITSSLIGTNTIVGGTANGLTLGTPIIGTITVPGTVAALSFSAAIAPGVGSIADVAGGTLTVNAQAGQVYYSAMGTTAGNRTIGTPLNPTGYQQLTYAFKASGSANGTLVWASIFRFSQNSGTPTIGTGSTWNYYSWRYNPIDTKFDFMGQSLNII